MKNQNSKVLFLAQAAMIAAIYVVLTVLGASLAFGEVQIRFAEALTILPVFTPAAIPGLFIGCLLGNILGGAILPDIIFGSIATLIGAVFTRMLRNKSKYLAPLPPVVANTIIVPFVLKYAYAVPLPIPFMMLTVGVGEVISAGVIGLILYEALYKYKTPEVRPHYSNPRQSLQYVLQICLVFRMRPLYPLVPQSQYRTESPPLSLHLHILLSGPHGK